MILVNIVRNIIDGSLLSRLSVTSYRLISNESNKCQLLNEESVPQDDLPNITINPYKKELQQCILCKLKIEPDYKNVRLLSQFQSRHTGRIYGRHITRLCKAKQDRVEQEIIKAQNAGLMGYMTKDIKFVNDPKLFDPNNPFKPHKY